MAKPIVAILKTKPETVLDDYAKLMRMVGYQQEISKEKETLLKLNLSWSLYFPACSTEPWQLEGVIRAMQQDGYDKIIPVENETVVTNPRKGARLNKWDGVFERYGLKFQPLTEVKWVKYRAKGDLLALYDIFGEDGHEIPEMFIGKNVVHLPTVKCVHPATEIFLGDGELVKIEDFVKKVHESNAIEITDDGDAVACSNHVIPSMVDDGSFKHCNASHFWKTPSPERVISIKTKTGRTVTVSEEHPFLTPKGWLKAKDLTKKTRIAIPRRIKIEGKSQQLPKVMQLGYDKIDVDKIRFKKGKKHSVEVQKKIVMEYMMGKTTTELKKELGMHYETIRKILYRYKIPIRWGKMWAKVPEKTSSEFWKWVGYFLAEGCANYCNGSMRFWWVNGNTEIVDEYKKLTKSVFGIDLKIKKDKRRIPSYYFDCNHLIPFFKKLGFSFPLVAGSKTIPSLLFKCPDKEVAACLQAYLDGDGTVARDGLHATSKSKKLIERIQLLFTRLGVVSFIKPQWNIATNGKQKEKQLYWGISVYSDDLVILSHHVKFHSKNKQENMQRLVKARENSPKKPSNWDTVPVDPKDFRRVRGGLGFTQGSTGKAGSVNNIENGYTQPTRPIMEYFINLFEIQDKEKRFRTEIDHFKLLCSDDLAWDYIEEIAQIQSDTEFLYDLTVPETNNFIGNGFILHNTHGHTTTTGAMKNAFGGLITKKRHHCHKKIHEVLVDLLTIQKEIHPGIFAVMDGTVCGNGPGPRTMFPVQKDYILASADQVAIDAISAKMMGFDPMQIPFIKMAHDKGLGCGDPGQIDVAGEDVKNVNFNFKTGKSPVIFMDQMFRKGPLSFVEPYLFHGPLFNACVFGSGTYHDNIWYPTIGKKRIDGFMKTPWGKMFQSY